MSESRSTPRPAYPSWFRENVSLSNLTSWQVGGSADLLAEPKDLEQLEEVLRWVAVTKIETSILGGGTNVLVSDRGVRGLTLSLGKLQKIETRVESRMGLQGHAQERLHIECWAGTGKSELLKVFLKYKLRPAIFLAGLPGDVGGGVAMNAGIGELISPREFTEIVDWFEVWRWDSGTIEKVRLAHDDVKWSYRHCTGWQPGVIVRVGLSWPNQPEPAVLEEVRKANQVRLTKQPLDLPSCGSVFVNPPGGKSGQLIESSGLKGTTIGGAQVSPKHANFIVNRGGATAQDIHDLILLVQKTVHEKSGVELKTEVVYLGDW